MTRAELIRQIRQKHSFLCVGLDTDMTKVPAYFRSRPNGMVEFNKRIIDATRDQCVAYKINTAFYEAWGARGWDALEETCDYIPDTHMRIADAKRADIGNTSAQYARAFFETLHFDAVTVAPYMGEDSLRPFLDYEHKWTIVLGLTSNPGASDFETLPLAPDGKTQLFEEVLRKTSRWGTPSNLMFVVGATRTEQLQTVRRILPEHFLLVPGVGAQGGDLDDVARQGLNTDVGLLVNASRSVIYAGEGDDFDAAAQREATAIQSTMSRLLEAQTT